MITIDEALDRILGTVRPIGAEEVRLLDALGRTSAESIVSPEQVPDFANSAMDGFAVSGAELEAGRREFRVVVDIPAGTYVAEPIGQGEAARIMTGAPLPPGVDTVVQVEHTVVDDDVMTVETPPATGANVRDAGEDVNAGDVIFEKGTLLGAAEVGLLAAVGVERVRVARRPRVAILATGSELVAAGKPLAPGQIRNSNSFTAYGQVAGAGADPILLGIARDDLDETRRLMAAALENDVVVTSGGVSVGDYDFVKQVQDELGVERKFWGVATKPGKPLAFGVRGSTLVFGVPGNPVAAMVSFELYVRPALLALQGTSRHLPAVVLRAVRRAGAPRQGPHRGPALPARARPRRDDPLHDDRPAGLRHPEFHGRSGGTVLRPDAVPGRRGRHGDAGHAARRQHGGAAAVPEPARRGLTPGLSGRARRAAAWPSAASPRRPAGARRCTAACRW